LEIGETMKCWIEADQVASYLEPGMTVFVAGATAEPREILAALVNQGERCAGVHFISVAIPGMNGLDFSTLHPEATSTAFFATPQNRASIASGRTEFLPLQYSAIFDYLEKNLKVDTVLAQLPPAQDDTVSLGISADFLPAVLDKAGTVIAELNARQPAPADAPSWPVDRLDYAVACDRPVPVFPDQESDTTATAIGRHVAELINDGDCLQIGIGAIPGAVLDALTEKNDLGIHSGLIADGVMALARSGNITGRYKSQEPNKIVTCTTLGSEALIQWAGDAQELAIRPVSYTHDVGVIRQIDNFVSINSAVEVDLFGQVSADMLGGQQWTGPGGAVDTMRGAALSSGGRSIVALKSTAAKGKKSRIVAALEHGTAATACRTDIDIVVTEHGARRVRHLSTAARAEALIEIAAPEFRDQLRDEWRAFRN
jgi:4-hydroxybutyrate CoA-transferase